MSLSALTLAILCVIAISADSKKEESSYDITKDPLYVETPYGAILGYSNGRGNIWTSIPYAAAPVGDLRFAAPQAPQPWYDTLYTMDDPAGCLQECTLAWWACPRVISEDCLYLNVFTPLNSSSSSSDKKSVMVFIHGGDYVMGYSGGLLYNGTDLVNLTDIILVTFNYRLGAQGFYYDKSTNLYGNYGYFDQVFAIEWVYNNIDKFGGNNNDITIFGESAGGVSVATHLINTTNTIIKAAIIESNPFGLPLRTKNTWGELPNLFKTYAGCDPLRSPNEQLKCLRDISAQDLLSAQLLAESDVAVELKWFIDLFMPWTPTVGTGVIDQQPIFAFQDGNYLKNVPIIAGVNENEGNLFVWEAFPDALSKIDYEGFVALCFDNVTDAEKVIKYYSSYNVTNTSDYRPLLSIIATDALFRCATHNVSNVIATDETNKALNYMYHFNQIASFTKIAFPDDPECWNAVCHGLELCFVFEPNLAPVNGSYTTDEWLLAQTVGYYWSSMAKNKMPGNGNPNRPVEWIPFNEHNTQNDIIFNTRNTNGGVRIESDYDLNVCQFWDTLSYNWIPK